MIGALGPPPPLMAHGDCQTDDVGAAASQVFRSTSRRA